MARLLEFLVLLGVGYWFFLRWKKQRLLNKDTQSNQSSKTESASVNQQEPQKMVACESCGLRLPEHDAFHKNSRYYCEQSHLETLDSRGWLGSARWVVSPNYDARPEHIVIDTLVIHHISLPSGHFGNGAIDQFFLNQLDPSADPYFQEIAHLKVSSHFLIDRTGQVTQYVSTHNKAWHAGVSSLEGREKCNDFSIGIELEGNGDIPFEAIQYQEIAKLTTLLENSFPIKYIVGHSDIAPGRKTDPGPTFEWSRFVSLAKISSKKLPFGTQSR
jgi:AmpD protein